MTLDIETSHAFMYLLDVFERKRIAGFHFKSLFRISFWRKQTRACMYMKPGTETENIARGTTDPGY